MKKFARASTYIALACSSLMAVLSCNVATPPVSPSPSERHIIMAAAGDGGELLFQLNDDGTVYFTPCARDVRGPQACWPWPGHDDPSLGLYTYRLSANEVDCLLSNLPIGPSKRLQSGQCMALYACPDGPPRAPKVVLWSSRPNLERLQSMERSGAISTICEDCSACALRCRGSEGASVVLDGDAVQHLLCFRHDGAWLWMPKTISVRLSRAATMPGVDAVQWPADLPMPRPDGAGDYVVEVPYGEREGIERFAERLRRPEGTAMVSLNGVVYTLSFSVTPPGAPEH
jgi:hypothetical protein